MVRPRLVEEGAPLYGPGSNAPPRRVAPTVDHDMEDDAHHLPQCTPTPMSSLQLAAQSSGLKIPSPKRRSGTSTSYQIGAGSKDSASASPGNVPVPVHTLQHHQFPHQPPYQYHHSIQPDHMTIGGNTHPNQVEMEMEAEHYTPYQNKPHPRHYHHGTQGLSHFNTTSTDSHHQACAAHHSTPPLLQTSFTIGGTPVPTEKMVGVEDHGHKMPMVVLDGANVAHAYGTAVAGLYSRQRGVLEPDATGIQVAVDYFQAADIRVLVVLPQYWFSSKRHPGDSQWNVKGPQHEVLNSLQVNGLIVSSPPADDDDAYALTIARREESRSLRRNGEGPGFVLSNDMFRDAQERDTTGALKHWLNSGRNQTTGPGRISYSFADMGTMNDHGERILDFVPNPRHPLIIWIEGMNLQGMTVP